MTFVGHARMAAVQLRMSVLTALQYRLGFFTDGVLGVGWSLLGIVPLFVALEHRGDIGGWGTWELVILTGCFNIMQGVFGALIQPALLESMNHIRRGTLDYLLLRPANSLFLCSIAAFSPWRFTELFTGFAMIGIGLVQLGRVPGPFDVLTFVAMGLIGLAALYALGVLVLCLSFRALQLQNLTFFMEAMMDFGRWPASVFRGFLAMLFTFVVPLAIMTTYPASALLGGLDLTRVFAAAATAAALLVIALLLWRRSIRGYTSASS